MFCIVLYRQPAGHKYFAKRTAEYLPIFPRGVLQDTGDHGSVRTRITEPFTLTFPIPPGDPFSGEGQRDQPHNCKECCVEELGSRSFGRITYCIGTNNKWHHPYTS